MRKSLLITTFFPPEVGGIQNYLYNLVKGLPQDKILVLAPKYDLEGRAINYLDFDKKQSFKIYREKFFRKILKPSWFFLLIKTILLVRREKVKQIHCGQIYPLGLLALWIKKILGIPYIVYTYALDITESRNNSQKKKILKNADKIITISEFTKKEIFKFGIKPQKIAKITPGIDFGKFKLNQDTNKIKDRYSLRGKKIILTIGRLVERKGHDMVIKALPEVLKKVPNGVYLIVGDGPNYEKLKAQSSKLKVEDKVIFTGFIKDEDLSKYYELCDVFITPSREIKKIGDVEGFGIVFLEAQAKGKPVIAGRSGGVSEAVLDGETGILVDPENTNEIAQVLIKLLSDQKEARRLGENGRKRVEKFDWRNKVEKLQKAINKI